MLKEILEILNSKIEVGVKDNIYFNEDNEKVLEKSYVLNDNEIKILFTYKDFNIVECKFFVNDNVKITKNKDNLKILNSVQNIVENFIKDENPNIFLFVSSDSSRGRSSLYKRFAMKLASDYNYFLLSECIEDKIFCIYKSKSDLENIENEYLS